MAKNLAKTYLRSEAQIKGRPSLIWWKLIQAPIIPTGDAERATRIDGRIFLPMESPRSPVPFDVWTISDCFAGIPTRRNNHVRAGLDENPGIERLKSSVNSVDPAGA